MMKLVLSALLVVCVVHGDAFKIHILQTGHSNSDNGNDISISGSHQPHRVELSFDDAFKSVPKMIEWASVNFHRLGHGLMHEMTFGVSGWLVGFLMRIELASVADPVEPRHFFLPPQNDENVEHRHRVIAKAVAELWMDLRTIDRTDLVLVNATDNTLTSVFQSGTFNSLKRSGDHYNEVLLLLSQHMYDNVDHAISSDPILASFYTHHKAAAESKVKQEPKATAPLIDAQSVSDNSGSDKFKVFCSRLHFRKLFVNKAFELSASKKFDFIFNQRSFDRYTQARALIQYAKVDAKSAELANHLYHEVVEQIARDLKFNGEDDEQEHLYSELKRKFESHPTISSQIHDFEKEISKHTVWDSEILSVKFLPF